MPPVRFRPTLLVLLAAWLGIVVFAMFMLMSAQISRWERNFDDDIRLLVSEVKNKLDTNEAVLAGFSAFLQAVDRDDMDSANRYAAAATAAYPHIYMLEVARRLPYSEQAAFEASLRKKWWTDFRIKDFSEITGRPSKDPGQRNETWPILFMYPSLPDAQAIYGLRLETVDYLAHSLALAHQNLKPVVSPIFALYEGDSAYILLQEVSRPVRNQSSELNFFGSTMTAMLIIKAQALIPRQSGHAGQERMQFSAFMSSTTKAESLLFERAAVEAGQLDRAFLPSLKRQLSIENSSQPTSMHFDRQLLWSELLNQEMLTILALLGSALLIVPWLTIRHYMTLDRAASEHERSAYLATHDLLTDLPNRFLFLDRFEQALRNWQRNSAPFALLLIDLDHFKEVNDRHGHEVGDQVLIATGNRMKQELRACDTIARQGGDEFIVLLVNVLDVIDARTVGEKLLTAIAEPIESAVGPLKINASIGIAICPAHGESLDILRKRADQAMYNAKECGRNKVSVFSSDAGYADARS